MCGNTLWKQCLWSSMGYICLLHVLDLPHTDDVIVCFIQLQPVSLASQTTQCVTRRFSRAAILKMSAVSNFWCVNSNWKINLSCCTSSYMSFSIGLLYPASVNLNLASFSDVTSYVTFTELWFQNVFFIRRLGRSLVYVQLYVFTAWYVTFDYLRWHVSLSSL